MSSVRDHGYGDVPVTTSSPEVVEKMTGDCPSCGCSSTYLIRVEVKNEMLKGVKGIGHYVGCPACPWASPMMTAAVKKDEG